jgi:hypothetical protein
MASRSDSTYSYLDLITLVLPGFFRSYDRYLRQGGDVSNRLAGLFDTFIPAVLSVLETDSVSGGLVGSTSASAMPPTAASLTCSEYVYRCYQDAGHPIAIEDPLASWSRRWSQPRRGGEVAAGEILDFHAALMHPQEASTPSQPIVRGPGGTTRRELAVRACKVLTTVVLQNLARRKYGPTIEAGSVLPDAVTPRDLWCSPSLESQAVLHLPPSLLDTDLDEPHH